MSVYSNEISQMVNKLLEKAVYKRNDENDLIAHELKLLSFFILKKIAAGNKIILTDLRDEIGMDYNILRKEIGNLEKLNLIKREEDPKDKRRKFIQVTESGLDQLNNLDELINEKLKFVIRDFSVNEEKAVLKFLSRINQLTLTHSKK